VVPVSVFEPGCDLDNVGEAEEVLVDVSVLVPLEDPEEVFVEVRVAVPVLELTIVFDCKGDVELDVDPVEVREPRVDNVPHGEPEEVFDDAMVLELVGVDEPVLDCVVVAV
jgi:hypothetical protein